MKDFEKAAMQKQAALLEQQEGNTVTQNCEASFGQKMTEQREAVDDCVRAVGSDLDKQSNRMADNLKESGADDATVQSAEQWRRTSQDSVGDAADRANEFIAQVAKAVEKGKQSNIRGVDYANQAAELAQNFAIQLDERSLSLASEVDLAMQENKDADDIAKLYEEANKDFESVRDQFEDKLGALEQRQVADEIEAEGKQIREESLRSKGRDVALNRLKDEMAAGIHSPDTERLIEEVGRDEVNELAEGRLNRVEARIEAHHKTSIQSAPELGVESNNLENLTRRDHEFGAHGRDFNKERDGVAADPQYDQQSGYGLDKRTGQPGPGEDLDQLVNNASSISAHEAEDEMIAQIDQRREQMRAEEQQAEERRRAEEREQLRNEFERDNERQKAERKDQEQAAEERRRQQMEAGRKAEERAAEERKRQQVDAERKRLEQQQLQREAERQAAERATDERREAEE